MRLIPIPGSGSSGTGDVDIGTGSSQIPTNVIIQQQYPVVTKAVGSANDNLPTVGIVNTIISNSVSTITEEVDTLETTVNNFNTSITNIQAAVDELETNPPEARSKGVAFASESLEEGMYIHTYRDGSITRCYRANAATGILANGYVESAASVGAEVTYYLNGINTKANDLPGGKVYLSTVTPGRGESTPPAARSTHWLQELGESIGANKHQFQPGFSLQLL